MGEWVILKLRITNYGLRNGEFGEATGRWGDWAMERMGDWAIGRLGDKMSCVFASLREDEGANYELRITERGVWRSDGATGRWGEWVIGRLGDLATGGVASWRLCERTREQITNYELRNVNFKIS